MSHFSGLQPIDFVPQQTRGPTGGVEYETFLVLVQRANQFLRSNPQLTINTCESVELMKDDRGWGDIDTVNSVYIADGEKQNRYVRVLRLWTQEKLNRDNAYMEIGYVNFVPQLISQEQVERLDSVVDRINQQLTYTPINGRIITLETQPIKWGSKGVDPDRTIWAERDGSDRFVNIIRIFYIHGPPQPCQIGLQDFVPGQLDSGGLFGKPDMESFQPVMERARDWLLSVPPHCRPVNVQTVTFRWSYNKGIDTKDMMYHEDKKELNYLRYLRVGYVVENPSANPSARSTIQLSAKLFVPKVLREPGAMSEGQYETQAFTRTHIDAWVKATGARIVCAESLVMRILSGGETRYGFGSMHTWNETTKSKERGQRGRTIRADERFAHVYRIYTDGVYRDPTGWVDDAHLEPHKPSIGSRILHHIF